MPERCEGRLKLYAAQHAMALASARGTGGYGGSGLHHAGKVTGAQCTQCARHVHKRVPRL